jgi:DNA modification methylase
MRGEHSSRKQADQRSNVNGAPIKPEWATGTGTQNMAPGTSIFDPVLCELAYRWFCPPAGLVLDPFAGGSVRGIVASKTGRQYVGVDLRGEQVAANREQAGAICGDPQPVWIVGDSANVATLAQGVEADFIFSCPPYADLERYSDDPLDLSTMDYPSFLSAYRAIISACVGMLKSNRFACFVVGDIRDGKGFYRNFVGDTVAAFIDAGMKLYNEAVLVTAVGSLPIRVGRQFESGRKLGKTHQNVLVFCKGNPKMATEAIGPVEFGSIEEESDNAA